MKQPGNNGVQGVEIEQLSVDPGMSPERAVELAKEVAEEAGMTIEAYHRDEYGTQVESEFVSKAIDFRIGDLFMVEHPGGPNDYYQVVSDSNFCRGIEVVRMELLPGDFEMENHGSGTEWDTFSTYGQLWVDWLRGRVIPVRREQRFVRTDTGAEVDL
jgi:hypothetical protein